MILGLNKFSCKKGRVSHQILLKLCATFPQQGKYWTILKLRAIGMQKVEAIAKVDVTFSKPSYGRYWCRQEISSVVVTGKEVSTFNVLWRQRWHWEKMQASCICINWKAIYLFQFFFISLKYQITALHSLTFRACLFDYSKLIPILTTHTKELFLSFKTVKLPTMP